MADSTSFTRWARAAAVVAAVAALAAWLMSAGGIFSPGRLHAGRDGGGEMGGVASHAELSRQCGACHASPFGEERMADRCLACHRDVRAELGDTTELHGILPGAGQCLSCHVEHQGPHATLTRFGGDGFAHERLGFSLAAHREMADGRPFTCSGCHGGESFRFAEATCESCHRDYQADFVATHVRDWGSTCRGCHEGTDRFTAFRHDTTDFRLVGAHTRTQCAACHTETRTYAAFAKAPNTCAGCHREEDAHQGRFGTDCGACHNPSRWEDAKFDHTFPLNHGGEASIACGTCHTEMPSFRTYTCYGCHEHARAIIREEHLDEGIRDFRNCAECHATGTKDEAEDRGGGREDRGRDRDRDRDDGDGGRGRGRGGRGGGD